MKTALLIISLWAMSFVAVTHAEGRKTPLVEVYCGFVVSEKTAGTTDGVTLSSFDERWDILVSYLENRESFFKVSDISDQKAAFDECLSKNRDILERGEFALSGIESIEQTKVMLAKAEPTTSAPALIASNLNLLEREISTPDMEVVYGFIPEKASEEVPSALLENAVESRQTQYAALWKEFTVKLKDSYLSQTTEIPVLTSQIP